MTRRQFIAMLGSGAAAWPVVARAQQSDRMRRIGALMGGDENDAQLNARLSEFMKGLAELGWRDGRNLQIDVRWGGADADRMRMSAKELVALQPDVILAQGTAPTAALQRETRTIPIVFAGAADPVGDGFVASLARPDGNITGFINIEPEMGGKWLQLLTEIALRIKRVAIMFNPDTAPGGGSYYLLSIEAAARSLKVEPIVTPVHSDAEITTAMVSLGREPGAGIVVMTDPFMVVHRRPIISLAARYNVPAVYANIIFARDGGLLSYGSDRVESFRRLASYVSRVLRGEKPADLPVQLPTKFEMAVNVRTAKALGLTVPQSILLRADEVIE